VYINLNAVLFTNLVTNDDRVILWVDTVRGFVPGCLYCVVQQVLLLI